MSSNIPFNYSLDKNKFSKLNNTASLYIHSPTQVKLQPPNATFKIEHSNQETMQHVIEYYHQTLRNSLRAQSYLKHRNLTHPDLISYFKLGFSDRTLGYHLPEKNRLEGATLRGRLQRLGIIKASGHELFRGSIVVPISERGIIQQVYGRKITKKLRSGTRIHSMLPNTSPVFFHSQAIETSDELILCTSTINALTYWCAGYQHVCAYLCADELDETALSRLTLSSVKRIVLSRTISPHGEDITSRLAEQLSQIGIDVYAIEFLKRQDANELVQNASNPTQILGEGIRKAHKLGKSVEHTKAKLIKGEKNSTQTKAPINSNLHPTTNIVTSEMEDHSLQHYLNCFLEWSASLNYSPATTHTRDICIRRFNNWCTGRRIESPRDVTKSVLECYRQYLFKYRKANGCPLSFSTQHAQLAPLKAFFKWLNRENHILYNPASDFELPRQAKRLPKHILSVEEINNMLNHSQIYGDIGIRDRAIMETFYTCGIRRMELAHLKVHDVNFNRGTLSIFHGKSQKDRVVPLGERALAWLTKYSSDVRPQLQKDEDAGYLFLTENGKQFGLNQITDLVTKYKKAVGIDKPGASHLFRHAMATHMLENGADIRFIQVILGHVNLTSTEIYTRVSIKKLQEVHKATHPAK